MATSVDRSTYNQLIDDITADVSNKAEADQISLQQYRNWILRAEQEICKRLKIYEQYALTMAEGIVDYPLRDRPLITAATNATPIEITSASHGLVADDRINIRDIEGNVAANGSMQINTAATNTFTLNEYADIESATVATPINVTTKTEHGWSTGDTVTISAENDGVPFTDTLPITVVDIFNFTLDGSTGISGWTSGGVATKLSTGSGAYTYGGQYWKTNELPTYVKNVVGIRRTWGNIYRPVHMVGEVDLLNDQIFESTFGLARSGYSVPVEASFININGQRYFHLFSRPLSTEDCLLICQIEIVPERHFTDNVSSQIALRSTYNEAIKNYAKAKLYEKLGDGNKVGYYEDRFEKQIRSHKQNSVGTTRITMSYR